MLAWLLLAGNFVAVANGGLAVAILAGGVLPELTSFATITSRSGAGPM